MKKGDLIQKEILTKVGDSLTGSGSPEAVERLVKELYPNVKYNLMPLEEEVVKENPGLSGQVIPVLAEGEIREVVKATVEWVVDNEVALKGEDGQPFLIDLNDEDSKNWVVIQESVPSYQSSVAQMGDEQLRAAIEDLRNQRTFITSKPKKTREKGEVIDRNDPMAVALASMPEDKKIELMKKMGMID